MDILDIGISSRQHATPLDDDLSQQLGSNLGVEKVWKAHVVVVVLIVVEVA